MTPLDGGRRAYALPASDPTQSATVTIWLTERCGAIVTPEQAREFAEEITAAADEAASCTRVGLR